MADINFKCPHCGQDLNGPEEIGGETIDWVRIEPENGIDELVTWVFRRHLELYREREIV